MLLHDALRATPFVAACPGPVVDVGSGGGTPGSPLAVELPQRSFALLEAQRRKCDFLSRIASELRNVTVVWGRAEEQPTDTYGVALARRSRSRRSRPRLCLPLVRPGGIAILWVGESVERDRVATVAEKLGGTLEADEGGLLVLRKIEPTPPGFPRRAGVAKKRPLA